MNEETSQLCLTKERTSSVDYWADQITTEWCKSVEGIINTGQLVKQALEALNHGEKSRLWERLPFSQSTGSRIARIAEDSRVNAYTHKLPASWMTIYELTKLDDDTFGLALETGTINPNMAQYDAAKLARELKRQERFNNLANPAPALPADIRYPVIYADPPWEYSHGNRAHGNRAFDNQYPTMPLEDICALPVEDLATDDAILFLWVTNPKSREAHDVVKAWGFTYKTNIVWVKDKIGMGFYVRQRHELLFIATRGNIPAPAPKTRVDSVFESPRQEHSRKPEALYGIIERMYPGLPKIELFAGLRDKAGPLGAMRYHYDDSSPEGFQTGNSRWPGEAGRSRLWRMRAMDKPGFVPEESRSRLEKRPPAPPGSESRSSDHPIDVSAQAGSRWPDYFLS